MSVIDSDQILDLLAPHQRDQIREWSHEEWSAVSNAFAMVAKAMQVEGGYAPDVRALDAIESALYTVWDKEGVRAMRWTAGCDDHDVTLGVFDTLQEAEAATLHHIETEHEASVWLIPEVGER